MQVVDGAPGGGRSGQIAKRIWVVPIAIGVVAGAIFLAVPEIDLLTTRAFYSTEAGFVGQRLGWIHGLRQLFIWFYFGLIGLSLAGLAWTWGGTRNWLRLGNMQWLFLAICLGVGPGLVANVMLKDQFGRARPKQVAEFGGSKTFTPALLPANQCKRNCSFVSGEAASVYVAFYAAAVILPQWSVVLVVIGTLGGLAAGLVRMTQGAHFLSDVVFAGIFMALTVLVVQKLMFGTLGLRNGVRP